MVAAAGNHVTGGAAGQLVEIGFCNGIQLKPKLTGKLRHIPEHIAELQHQRLARVVGEHAVLVAQHLFHLVGHLTRFTAEPEGGIDRVLTHLRIASRGASSLLVGVEIHWQIKVGGLR
jgi:hypothetical protein